MKMQSIARTDQIQRVFRWLAVITFALTALQPVLGAFGFFQVSSALPFTNMHEMTAHLLALLAMLLFGLAFFAGFERRGRMAGMTGALLLTMIVQIGLGYLAREDAARLGYHIPLGVAICAQSLVLTLLAFGLRFQRGDVQS